MLHRIIDSIWSSYCYGPADLIHIQKRDRVIHFSLQDSVGNTATAIYHGCAFWHPDLLKLAGLHLSLVQRATVPELLQMPNAAALLPLQLNDSSRSKILYGWEACGLSFYLHQSSKPDTDFLIVAKSLEYLER